MENEERYRKMNSRELAETADAFLREKGFTRTGRKLERGEAGYKAYRQYLFERGIHTGAFRGERR